MVAAAAIHSDRASRQEGVREGRITVAGAEIPARTLSWFFEGDMNAPLAHIYTRIPLFNTHKKLSPLLKYFY